MVGREGFRVEPYGFRGVAYAAAVMVAAVLAVLWLVPTVPFNEKVAMFAIGSVAGTSIFSLLIWLYNHERRLGPYLVANRREIRLRHDVCIPSEDYDRYVITRRWELTGDGETQVSYLVVESKSGKRSEILASIYHREIVKLKSAIDERMSILLAARRDPSSAPNARDVA